MIWVYTLICTLIGICTIIVSMLGLDLGRRHIDTHIAACLVISISPIFDERRFEFHADAVLVALAHEQLAALGSHGLDLLSLDIEGFQGVICIAFVDDDLVADMAGVDVVILQDGAIVGGVERGCLVLELSERETGAVPIGQAFDIALVRFALIEFVEIDDAGGISMVSADVVDGILNGVGALPVTVLSVFRMDEEVADDGGVGK